MTKKEGQFCAHAGFWEKRTHRHLYNPKHSIAAKDFFVIGCVGSGWKTATARWRMRSRREDSQDITFFIFSGPVRDTMPVSQESLYSKYVKKVSSKFRSDTLFRRIICLPCFVKKLVLSTWRWDTTTRMNTIFKVSF